MCNDTEKLHLFLNTRNEDRSLLPKSFIGALHQCVECKMTCEQITAIILLSSSVMHVKNIDVQELAGRTREVANVLLGTKLHEDAVNRYR